MSWLYIQIMGQGYGYVESSHNCLKWWPEVSVMESTITSFGTTLRKTRGLPPLAKTSNFIHCNSGFYFHDQDPARTSHHLSHIVFLRRESSNPDCQEEWFLTVNWCFHISRRITSPLSNQYNPIKQMHFPVKDLYSYPPHPFLIFISYKLCLYKLAKWGKSVCLSFTEVLLFPGQSHV